MKANAENEKIKRKYFRWLKEAEGLSDATVDAIEKAINVYEDFTDHLSFGSFGREKAVGFKRWLERRTHHGKPTSVTSRYNYVRHLKRFFTWLSGQSGFKRRISLDNVSYLTLDKRSVREATSARLVEFPSVDYVNTLVGSIDPVHPVDRRDRALIAFLLCSGARDMAVATLPLKGFDAATGRICQDPRDGVRTKFSKLIISTLLPFDDCLIATINDWVDYLTRERLFGPSDPLFPRSRVEHIDGGLSFVCRDVDREPWKGTGPIRELLRKRSSSAGLRYYHPHTFRHAAIYIAMTRAKSGEQIKAVSQNFGHEDIGTTLSTYGTLDQRTVADVIGRIDFSAEGKRKKGAISVEAFEKFLREQRDEA